MNKVSDTKKSPLPSNQENKINYKRLIEAAPDISYIYGTKSGAIFWSPQVKDILGISPSTLFKDPFAWINAIHPKDQKIIQDTLDSLEHKKMFSIEYRIKDKKGKWLWLNDRTISVNKVGDEFIIEGLAQDITLRKEIEQQLKQSEERFRKAFMTSPDAININRLDDGLYVSINSGFTQITGYEEKDVIGKTSLELNIWANEKDREHLVKLLKETGKVENLEAKFRAKDGSFRYGLMSASLIKLNNEPHLLNITRNITDRVNVQNDLKKQQYYLEKSQEVGKLGAWELNIATEELTWTQETYHIFGVPSNTPMNLSKFMDFVHPEDRDSLMSAWNEALNGKQYDIEHRIIVNQEAVWVHEKAEIVFDKSGKALSAIGAVQNINDFKKLSLALEESEEKYRLIVENANDGIEITFDDKIIYANNRFAEILGYDQNEIHNIPFSKIFTDEAKIELAKRTADRQAGKDLPSKYETTFQRKDGKYIDVEVNYQIINYKEHAATFAIIRDVTESRKMETELRKLSTAVEQSPTMIVIVDINGKIEYANPIFSNTTGYAFEEVRGETPRVLKSGVLPDKTYEDLWKTISSGNIWRGEFRNKKKSGEMYWENASISPIIDNNGQITHYLKVAEDISEWKEIEEALRQSEEQYRLIVENANDGILISQKDEFIYKNLKFVHMLGYNENEFRHITFKDIYTEEGIKDLFERHIKREAGEKLPSRYETTFKKKDGSIIHVEVNYQIIDYHGNEATFAIIRDISDKKEADKALKQALARAEESDQLKSAFLANMSHEIRTPMNGIIGFANLLKNKKISEEKKDQYLDIIEQSGKRLMNIINDLIDISKIEAKQIDVKKSFFNLNPIMEYLYQFFELECNNKGITLNASCPQTDIFLHTDKDKLEAILINLLKNAIKFTNQGSIAFGCDIQENTVSFYVKDTGIGIPKEKQKHIFDRFAQVDNNISKSYEGAGLGLAISSAFVEMLGGSLSLESEPQQGSTFSFSIPYKVQNKFILSDKEINIPQATKETGDPVNQLKILVAEDDDYSYKFLEILLEKHAKNILHASNGKEAIDLCKDNPDIDLILMDVKMPLLDGYQATKHIRRFNQDVKIIAQTAYALSDDKDKMMALGCNDYITKPIQEEDLTNMIEKMFRK